ncbi:MAG: CBS domain-containing protein, partial [Cyanobacteria bacterium J06555_13]
MSSKQLGLDKQPLMVGPDTLLKDAIAQMSQASGTCQLAPSALASSALAQPEEALPALVQSEAGLPASRRCSYVLITQHQKLLGIVTERDLVRLTAEGVCFASTTLQTVMTENVVTLKASAIKDAFTPLTVMRQHHIRHLPVVDDRDNVCGVITSAKLREALPASALLKRRQVQDVMVTDLITATPATPVIEIAKLMTLHRLSCVIIQASEAAPPQGIITEYDIAQIQRLELNLNALAVETVMSTPLVCIHPE